MRLRFDFSFQAISDSLNVCQVGEPSDDVASLAEGPKRLETMNKSSHSSKFCMIFYAYCILRFQIICRLHDATRRSIWRNILPHPRDLASQEIRWLEHQNKPITISGIRNSELISSYLDFLLRLDGRKASKRSVFILSDRPQKWWESTPKNDHS